jgi:RNA-directed DNA polymerase
MNDHGQSDGLVVPAKPPNKPASAGAEVVEERRPAEGNTASETRPGHRAGMSASSDLDRVRRAAARDKQARFTALLHHLTIDRLRDAYRMIRPGAAAGTDGVGWHDYGQDLEENLSDLHARVHRGAYRATPARRVFIPKPDGRQRPLGVAALEDKIVQRALVEVLNAVYEEDFLGFSYGFRPGRSPHDALDALAVGIERRKVNWVLKIDVKDLFDTLDRGWMMRFLEHRIADRRVLRLIQKWLAAGVIEDGKWSSTETGTAQGASVSPLLANVFLHYVLDLWVQQWRQRHARGDVILVRFADDVAAGFQHRSDAERFLAGVRERFAEFGLEIATEKTRLVQFGCYAAERRTNRGLGKPETFQFLGFTHVCAKTKAGKFRVRRVTNKKRMSAKLRELKTEMRRRAHLSIPAQGRWLASVLAGHYRYFAVPGNIRALGSFRTAVIKQWMRTLRRRSQRHRMTWQRMTRIAQRWLPIASILHPWPNQRFDARTQGRSPVR